MKLLFIVLLMFGTTGVADVDIKHKLDMLHTVALVTVSSSEGGPGGTGSGVVVFSQQNLLSGFSLILTARHVVDNAGVGGLYVTFFPDGGTYPAEIVKKNDKYDLALLRVNKAHDYVAIRSPVIELNPFTPVYKIGAGLGEDPFPTEGIIERFEDDTGKMYISAPIVFGDSGGGIFAEIDGQFFLIGIVTGTAVTGYMGHPVVINFMGLCYNIFAVNDFLSER